MPFADPARVNAQVMALIGRPSQQEVPLNDVQAARVDAGMQILRAIAGNNQQSYFSSLTAMVTVTHNSFLPAHDGEPGIPSIIPFNGGTARDGYPRDSDEIDGMRENPSSFSGSASAVVAHDATDADGKRSPLSCFYSFINGRFKFTGYTAQVPLVQLTRAMADTGVPENYEPTLVKLMPIHLVRANSPYFDLAKELAREGKQDLVEIAGGAMRVLPVPNVTQAQKQSI